MSHDNEYNSAYLATLARIDLSVEEEKVFNANLKKILAYMDMLEKIDVKGVLPCAHVLETVQNVMDEDEPGPLFPRETFLENAPDSIGGMIRVPPVMQQEE